MTDDLKRLQDALKRETPAPSEDARQAALRAAMESFERTAQGSADTARPIQDRTRRAGFWKGLGTMIDRLTSRSGMLATTGMATIAIALVVTNGISLKTPEMEPLGNELNKAASAETPSEEAVDALRLDEADDSTAIGSLISPALNDAPQGQSRRGDALVSTDADRATPADSVAIPEPEPRVIVPNAPVAVQDQGQRVERSRAELAPPSPATSESDLFADGRAQRLSTVDTSDLEQEETPLPQGLAAGLAPGQSLSEQQNTVARVETRSAPVIVEEAEAAFTTPGTEEFNTAPVNPVKVVKAEPVSTFSIDVDTASYAFVRSALMDGYLPNPDAVRVEEMVNYFDYDYPAPDSLETPFRTSVSVTQTPWNQHTQLMHIGIQGYDLTPADRPPLNLVFLIDTSGSMNQPNKLPLLIKSFRLLLSSLSETDQVAIVTYAGSAGLALEPTLAGDERTILGALERLSAGGSTAGQAGLQQAYAVAQDMAEDGEVSRVILATDGDFNVGISNPDALKTFVEDKRRSGTYLSVLGFGRGNYQDDTMQTLAQNGNGTAAYIDTLAEAQKVLVDEVSGALFPIANDVKIQVEFNPAEIAEYRLIGYETRALAREDFNNDRVDAGEIGAGHTVTALYEITPVGSPAIQVDDLRYAEAEAATVSDSDGELAFLKLRYKRPGEATSQLVTTPILSDRADIATSETRFAASVAGFGQLLKTPGSLGEWDFEDALALAANARGADPFGYRAEYMGLVRLARAADNR